MNDAKLEKLLSSIERDWVWRQRELTFFKQALSKVDEYQKNTLARAGILLLYAHWEGFIKHISQKFLDCFAKANINTVPEYVLISHLARMSDTLEAKYSKFERVYHSLHCLSEGSQICSTLDQIIRTESNLDSKNLKQIAELVGANFSQFETRLQFIDYNFVSVRHAIAHGEGRKFSEKEFLDLERDITTLMNIFKKNIIDSAVYSNEFNKKGPHHNCMQIKTVLASTS